MIAVVRNDPLVPAGTLARVLDETGLSWVLVQADQGEALPGPEGFSALVVLGGTQCALDEEGFPFLPAVKALIRDAVRQGRPFMGICLGGQMAAEALGGRVVQNGCEELGAGQIRLTREGARDPLFNGLPDPFPAFFWHRDSLVPPPGSVLLAGSDACPHQAFRFGDLAYGLQFHPEVTPEIVSVWSRPSGRESHFVADFERGRAEFDRQNRRLLANFLQMARSHRAGRGR